MPVPYRNMTLSINVRNSGVFSTVYLNNYLDEAAVIAATFTISSTLHPLDKSLTGFASPCNKGP